MPAGTNPARRGGGGEFARVLTRDRPRGRGEEDAEGDDEHGEDGEPGGAVAKGREGQWRRSGGRVARLRSTAESTDGSAAA